MKVIVWHHNRELIAAHDSRALDAAEQQACLGQARAANVLWNARCYKPVAVVTVPESAVEMGSRYSNALDKAWELTNSIERPWADAKPDLLSMTGVVCQPLLPRCRSSMVGDIFQLIDGAAVEEFACANVGFKRLTDDHGRSA